VVKEELGQEGQVLAVDRVFVAVDFKHSDIVFFIPIDLIPGGVEQRTDF
jgi:hypothetical protein